MDVLAAVLGRLERDDAQRTEAMMHVARGILGDPLLAPLVAPSAPRPPGSGAASLGAMLARMPPPAPPTSPYAFYKGAYASFRS